MRKVTIIVLLGLFAFSQLSADLLPRLEEVNIEDALTLNVGGIGNIIAGVDVDGDGVNDFAVFLDETRNGYADFNVYRIGTPDPNKIQFLDTI